MKTNEKRSFKSEMPEIFPYLDYLDLMVKHKGKTPFEKEIYRKLDLDITLDKEGCKLPEAHIQLGSKIHIKDFYHVEKLFRDNYYSDRFAWMLSKYIWNNLDEKKRGDDIPIVVVGYGNYSELSISSSTKLLNSIYKEEKNDKEKKRGEGKEDRKNGREKFSYCIVSDVEELTITHEHNLRNNSKQKKKKSIRVIIVVPIGSTLTTQYKIYEKLQERVGENSIELLVHPICLVVVAHKNTNENVVKNFWKEVNKEKKTIKLHTALSDITEKIDKNKLGETKYFFYVESEWYLPENCRYCWPTEPDYKILPLLKTDKASVTPKIILSPIESKCMEDNNKYCDIQFLKENRKRKEKQFEGAIISSEMVKYGHIEREHNHYPFYIDTESFFSKNEEQIKKWLEDLRKDIGERLSEPVIIVSPMHETNSTFINAVNNIVFERRATILHIKKYGFNSGESLANYKPRKYSIFFVDDTMCTGKSYYNIMSIVESEGYKISGAIVLLNRLNYKTNKAIENQLETFFSFCLLESPVMPKESCYICKAKKKKEKVLNYFVIDASRKKCMEEIKELEPKNFRDNSTKAGNKGLDRLKITHELYLSLNKLNKEDIGKKIKELMQDKKSKSEKLGLIEILAQPPFTFYKDILENVYKILVEEFEKEISLIKDEKNDISQFLNVSLKYIVSLIKHLASLGYCELLERRFLFESIKASTKKYVEYIKDIGEFSEIIEKTQKYIEKAKKEKIEKKRNENEMARKKRAGTNILPLEEKVELKENEIKDIVVQKGGLEEFYRKHNFDIDKLPKSEKDISHIKEKFEECKIQNSKELINDFNLIYTLSAKELIVEDEARSFRLEKGLNEILNESGYNLEGDFGDLLKMLYLENNVILKNALNILSKNLLKDKENVKKSEPKNTENRDINEIRIQVNDTIEKIKNYLKNKLTKNNHKYIYLSKFVWEIGKDKDEYAHQANLDYLSILLSLKIFLNFINKKEKNVFELPLIKFIENREKEREYATESTMPLYMKVIFQHLLRIAGIEENKGGVFLALKRYPDKEENNKLYILEKVGKNSEKLGLCLEDSKEEKNWSLKMIKGVKSEGNTYEWTNIVRYKNDDIPKHSTENISFSEMAEAKKLDCNSMFFLVIKKYSENDFKSLPKPLGVLVFYTLNEKNPFTLEKQRYLMLLRDEISEFLSLNYENYTIDELIDKKEYMQTIQENIEKFRHGDDPYVTYPLSLIQKYFADDNGNFTYKKINKDICLKTAEALYVQLKFILSKWRIGHLYSVVVSESEDELKKNLQNESLTDYNRCDTVIRHVQEECKIIKDIIENDKEVYREYIRPNLFEFKCEIDNLCDKNNMLWFKIKNDWMTSIIWEFLLNFIKHNTKEKENAIFKIIIKDKDMYILKTCSKNNSKNNSERNKEGFKIGLLTIKKILKTVGASLEDNVKLPNENEPNDCTYFVLRNIIY